MSGTSSRNAGSRVSRSSASAPALEQRSRRVRLARLEADIAYFQARLQLLGDSDSQHQKAQRRAFDLLLAAFAAMAGRLREVDQTG